MLDKIISIAREAGGIILNAVRSHEMVAGKEGHANLVTTYDKAIEDFLKEKLPAAVPGAAFMGEEGDMVSDISHGYVFIVDPIDGTTNFIKDYKVSCVSIGLLKDGEPYIGVVYNPYMDEMFSAEKGKGAFLNGKRIRVSGETLENSLVLFGSTPYYDELKDESFRLACSFAKICLDVRRSGSAALDLCNIAAGRAELFYELRLSPWDYAAGAVLVTEAGGRIFQTDGRELVYDRACSVTATSMDKDTCLDCFRITEQDQAE